MDRDKKKAETPDSAETPKTSPQHIISVQTLLGDAKEVVLEHKGQHYRLRITSNDKIILTK